MNHHDAMHTVAVALGGESIGKAGTLYRYPSLGGADRAVTVLNALEPGCTGAACGNGIVALFPAGDPS